VPPQRLHVSLNRMSALCGRGDRRSSSLVIGHNAHKDHDRSAMKLLSPIVRTDRRLAVCPALIAGYVNRLWPSCFFTLRVLHEWEHESNQYHDWAGASRGGPSSALAIVFFAMDHLSGPGSPIQRFAGRASSCSAWSRPCWRKYLDLVVAIGLAAATFTGVMTPWLLLALTFGLSAGDAVESPTWRAVLLELVRKEDLAAAAALNGIEFNIARAIGPALASASPKRR
jgi:hypothetical protein